MSDFLSMIPGWLPYALGVVVLLIGAAALWLKNIGGQEIAITERRYLGKPLDPARAFALEGEVGLEAQYLTPGLKIIPYPFKRVVKRAPFFEIADNELGIVSATDGAALPSGRIFAEDAAGEQHDNFQDPVAFLKNGGVRGTQLRFLTNGQFKLHPELFQVQKIQKTVVPKGKIGLVSAADGAPLQPGQLVGKSVSGHDNFQKAEIFLKQGGQKGPQVDFLRPGTYNIHTGMFKVEFVDATSIDDGNIGIVEALGGKPMPAGDVVADSPEGHNNFQDGEAFLNANGVRGPQTAVLAPGTYYINTSLFRVTARPQLVVKQGEVAVLIANHGKDPASDDAAADKSTAGPVEGQAKDPAETRLNQGTSARHVVPKGFRGICKEVLSPGRYNLNPMVYQVVIVPTTTRSVEWAADTNKGGDQGNFDPFEVVSNDGFPIKVEVRFQYRVLPENAPYVISKLGSIAELERNVIHPQIDGIFRAEVSKSPAIKYQTNRAEEQKKAEVEVRADLERYRVEVVSVMITNIHLPEQLMKTTQQRNLAQQEESMWDAKELAEKRRIAYEQTKADADAQKDVITAKAGIEKAEHLAAQKEKEAQGEAKRIKLVAEANAEQTRVTGEAEAAAIRAKGDALGAAYQKQAEALGQGGIATVEALKVIAEAGLNITPSILVNGGGAAGGGDLGQVILALLANQMQANSSGTPKAVTAAETPADASKK